MRRTDSRGPAPPYDRPLTDRDVAAAFLLVALVPVGLFAISQPLLVGGAAATYVAVSRGLPRLRRVVPRRRAGCDPEPAVDA